MTTFLRVTYPTCVSPLRILETVITDTPALRYEEGFSRLRYPPYLTDAGGDNTGRPALVIFDGCPERAVVSLNFSSPASCFNNRQGQLKTQRLLALFPATSL